MDEPTRSDEIFERQRRVLCAVAYRMLGSWSDAEDVVQDAWLRWNSVDHARISDPRAYLIRVTTRLAIDRSRQVSARRETYVGPWLPDPVLTGKALSSGIEAAESISLAMMIVLETLTPLERAVFVLRDVFSFSYSEIAEALDRAEPAVRQLARRARAHVEERDPRFHADARTNLRLTELFLNACTSGKLKELMQLLAPDVTLIADGGPLARAPRRPIHGADNVARFLIAIVAEPGPGFSIELRDVNGRAGLVASEAGRDIGVLLLDTGGSDVERIYLISNPAKLAGLRDT